MKKINESILNEIVSKVLTETLEERADELTSKLKSHMEEKKGGICECGGTMYEGVCNECGKSYMEEEMDEDIYDVSKGFPKPKHKGGLPPAQPFDYVQEEDDMDVEPKTINKEACKYHMERFGPDDEVTMEVCGTLKESLKGKQHKIDVAEPKGKITAADFKKLRDMKKSHKQVEEGNAFSGALAKAKEEGKSTFKVDGKKYDVKENKKQVEEKWKGEVEVEKTGEYGDMTIGEINAEIKKLKDKNEKTMESGKKVPHADRTKMSQLYFAKRAKQGWKGEGKAKVSESVTLTENELIEFIEKIVLEQKDKFKQMGLPKGMEVYNKVHRADGKENEDAIKAVDKKMKEYLKDGSKGEYDMNPKMFPLNNGQIQKMAKKAYIPSDAVQDYTDAFTAAGLENLMYDEINPNEEWVDKNVEGSSVTGNNPEWANAVDTGVNKKRNKIRKQNLLGAVKKQAYNKAPQPIVSDESGEANSGKFNPSGQKSSANKANKILTQLESTEPKENKKLNEEFDKMKKLISYNQKTQ